MQKYWIVLVLLILGFFGGFTSFKETNSDEDSLVGLWVSTKVDTLTQYIKPVKPDAFVSNEMQNCTLDIKADGSFQMIESGDTISGIWNPDKPDTLQLAIHENYYERLLVDFANNNNLIISNNLWYISMAELDGGGTYEVNWYTTISKHFIRK